MRYISTRGDAPELAFEDVLLAGLAADGGLYTPVAYPRLEREAIAALAGLPFAQASANIIAPFVGEAFSGSALGELTRGAYAGFRHAAVAPLTQIDDNLFVLELFHGPTLAFKDVAMQLLGRMMNEALARRGLRATIVGATSGDTGAAAIEAFRGLDRVDVFILYPHERVSNVQRRQMTTIADDNIHTIALTGSFDDAQAILKALFRDQRFREEVGLAGVNSINWARVVAQTVYYFTSAVALGGPLRAASFAVPTGNFGDILAGFVAKRMGLPIDRLLIATNANDILARVLASGAYELRAVTPTLSPSMDIQISSNFERLLFDMLGRDPAQIRALMGSLDQSRRFSLAPETLAAIRAEFDACSSNDEETTAEIVRTFRASGYVLDPHGATGVRAARRRLAEDPATPVVALATAHPAKFPDAIEAAIGRRPPLPEHLAPILEARERFSVLDNDVATVAAFIRARARAARGTA
ncbi:MULTISPECIES: threonine synthase [Methylosinus]|uniref:Threonine synthase n=1 Tax=Methylosinus trichosporium (strain ATCC 35070 / NCIMB 11131 / UNIQEM 75 / OB3b) TaxID=595536 RepID=A0A2D2CZI5_METT3|nr:MULTISPECIES: threonine synthase [Methylosinus]ATQ68171.1 threonine synthase [Methylosinus trichosporium OB3b]OBS53436.1 threonine synthase [Methylosinus sp. 3S-1]